MKNVFGFVIEIPQSSLGRWRYGAASPSADNLKKLAEYFDVTADFLLGKEKTPTDSVDERREYLVSLYFMHLHIIWWR